MKCIAPFISVTRFLLNELSLFGNKLETKCSNNLSRLYSELASYKSKTRKYVVYILSDYMALLRKQSIDRTHQQKLQRGIYSLIDICSQHELRQLLTIMGDTEKELFKKLYSDYDRDHKFKGKV
eukprot:TRINITY_DN4279_c0_g1_i1.p1 TRINITY_DN4279_c0_g1~~TRINITY_DN4279_c0_g1_i1.p1  ORF type:complete len:124 (+),score=19.96 TRINITY_DN4279_c0_g1_i1:1-372(+)